MASERFWGTFTVPKMLRWLGHNPLNITFNPSLTMTKPACENCKFWSFEAGFGDHKFGDCHRYPPTVIWDADDGEHTTAFPETGMNQWCGEWGAK